MDLEFGRKQIVFLLLTGLVFCHPYGVGMWMGCGAWWEELGGQVIESPLILAWEGFGAKVKTACLGTYPAGSRALQGYETTPQGAIEPVAIDWEEGREEIPRGTLLMQYKGSSQQAKPKTGHRSKKRCLTSSETKGKYTL